MADTPKYNLDALKDKEVRAAITEWVNGKAPSDYRVTQALDKVFIPIEDTESEEEDEDGDGDGDGGQTEE